MGKDERETTVLDLDPKDEEEALEKMEADGWVNDDRKVVGSRVMLFFWRLK